MAVRHDLINDAMNLLGGERPIFHSEADFQFALSGALKRVSPDVQLRLEYPVGRSVRGAVDLVALSKSKPAYGLELKY